MGPISWEENEIEERASVSGTVTQADGCRVGTLSIASRLAAMVSLNSNRNALLLAGKHLVAGGYLSLIRVSGSGGM
jgi:hypothetical protein